MLHIDFPFSFDSAGRTATTSWRDHKRDMLLQFLLTLPGERVNRPDFGTPLSRMCFEGNSQGMAEVIQFVAKAGLQRWLGDVVEVIELSAIAEESMLLVDLKYRVRGEDEVREERRRVPFPGGTF
jgi:phage baseplate assembly protein W